MQQLITLIIVLVLTSGIQLVCGLNCYQCTTIKDYACNDALIRSSNQINSTYCTPGMLWSPVINDVLPGFISVIYNTISTALSSFTTPKSITMLCIKVEVSDARRGPAILRMCTYVDNEKIKEKDPEKRRSQIASFACSGFPSKNVSSCHVCDQDGCNLATRVSARGHEMSFLVLLAYWLL